jgi:hypothetical protein
LLCDARARPVENPVCKIAGVNRKDIAAADCKEAQTTGCIRHLLTASQYSACLKANKPKPSDAVCQAFGKRMVGMANEALTLKCAFIKGSGGWDETREYWQRQCKSGDIRMTYNEAAMKRQLDKCKAGGSPTPNGK